MADDMMSVTNKESLRKRGRFLMIACAVFALTLIAVGAMLYKVIFASA